MFLGHLACAGLAKQAFFEKESLLFLGVCAYGPDLLDKPASMFFEASGRGIGHSLLAFIFAAGVGWVLARRGAMKRTAYLGGLALWFSHLAFDVVQPSALYWPLAGDLGPGYRFSIWEAFSYYTRPVWRADVWFDFLWCTAAIVYWTSRALRKPVAHTN